MSLFTGRDLARIAVAVNNNKTGNYVNWRAVRVIAQENELFLLEEIYGKEITETERSLKAFRDFLETFDDFVEIATAVLGPVPGGGQLLEIVSDLYFWVREAFPLEG